MLPPQLHQNAPGLASSPTTPSRSFQKSPTSTTSTIATPYPTVPLSQPVTPVSESVVPSLPIQAIPPSRPDSKSLPTLVWRKIKQYITRKTSKREKDFTRQIGVEFRTPDGGHDNKFLQCLVDTGTEGPGMINEDSLPLSITREHLLPLDDRGPAYSVSKEPIDLVGMIEVKWAGPRYGLINFPRRAITTRLYVASNIEYDIIFGQETILDRGFFDNGYFLSAAGYHRRVAPPPKPATGAEMEKALTQSEIDKINYAKELAAARRIAQTTKSSLLTTSNAGPN